jgi:cytochrome P450
LSKYYTNQVKIIPDFIAPPEKFIKTDVENKLLAFYTDEQRNHYQAASEFLDQCALDVTRPELNEILRAVPEDQLQPFIKLMFFAGQDTTSSLIEYLVVTLGQKNFQEWQEILYQRWKSSEQSLVDFALESNDLDWILKEALRLHPPFFATPRMAMQNFSIDALYPVPSGTEIHLSHFYSQRDFRRWGTDSEEFDPNRQNGNQQAVYPFSYGPTACLGKPFANQFLKIFLMTLISKHQWNSLSRIERLSGTVTLKIEPPVEIFLQKRSEPL